MLVYKSSVRSCQISGLRLVWIIAKIRRFPIVLFIKSLFHIFPGGQGFRIRLHKSKSFINEFFSFVGEFELISRIRDRSFSFIFMKEKTDKVKNLLPSNRWETTYIF